MSSSTSSSETPLRRRALVMVLVGIVALNIVLEIFTRTMLFPHSADFQRFADYPARARALCALPGFRLAFVGNSATQKGIDPKAMNDILNQGPTGPAACEFLLADGSMINTWHFITKRCFWTPGRKPDLIVINYFDHCLRDGNSLELGRLALFFTTPDDIAELRALELKETSALLEFQLSRTWRTYAARDRIKKRVLNVALPHYKELAEELNREQSRPNDAASTTPPSPTFAALTRYLDAAKAHQTPVVFVAFPTFRSNEAIQYALDSEAESLVRDAGMGWVDLRFVPELRHEHYYDDLHLTPAGAAIYTRRLADAIEPYLAKAGKKAS